MNKLILLQLATITLLSASVLPSPAAPDGKAWVVVTNGCQVYAFKNDLLSSLVATPGTVFAVSGHHQVTVQKGSVTVIAAGKPVQVVTTLGTYEVPKGAAAHVNQGPFGSVEVAGLLGKEGTFNVNYRGQTAQVPIALNNQTTFVESQVATAGGADYVASLDAKAGPVNGLMEDQKAVKSFGDYVSQLQEVDRSTLPNGMRTALVNLIRKLSDKTPQKAKSDRES